MPGAAAGGVRGVGLLSGAESPVWEDESALDMIVELDTRQSECTDSH